jgi:guanylate kinase
MFSQALDRGALRQSMLGPLIVVSGPSGGGKSTVIGEVLKTCPRPVRVAVTATTRPPRAGEVDGRNYQFWTRETFEAEIASGSFLEHAIVHETDWYGTPVSEVDPYRKKGIAVILVIDVQGAEQVRRVYPEVFSVFLHAPNDDYQARLLKRGDSPTEIERRLQTAKKELARAGEYTVQLVNDDLNETVREMCRLIEEQFHPAGRT